MLIIFDLDDTLIDTSGSTVPVKLKDALKAMVQAGLKVPSFDKALDLLTEVDSRSPNGEESIRTFLRNIKADSSFAVIGAAEFYKPLHEDITVKLLQGAREVLSVLQRKYTLVLVSKGSKELQYQKMKKAGIDTSIFSKIIITEEYNKRQKYEEIMKEFKSTPLDTIVVGDKFYSDLLPAKELGIKTVQVLWGRALKYPEEGADYKIKTLRDLPKIVEQLQ